jgi:hypothetical protein
MNNLVAVKEEGIVLTLWWLLAHTYWAGVEGTLAYHCQLYLIHNVSILLG